MTYKYLSTGKLKSWIDEGRDLTLLNVLPEDYFKETHIEGSINIDSYKMNFVEEVGKVLPDKARTIVIYDTGPDSEASNYAIERMYKAGWTNVYEYRAGLDGWKKALNKTKGTGETVIEIPKSKVYAVDINESVVRWSGRNMNNIHRGTVKLRTGKIIIKSKKLFSATFIIEMNTIEDEDLENKIYKKMLETHLRSEDFFNVKAYPEAKIIIKEAEEIGPWESGVPNMRLTALLKIKNVIRKVVFPATVQIEKDGRLNAHAHFSFDRTLWKVKYGSTKFFKKLAMHLVDDEVSMDIKIIAK